MFCFITKSIIMCGIKKKIIIIKVKHCVLINLTLVERSFFLMQLVQANDQLIVKWTVCVQRTNQWDIMEHFITILLIVPHRLMSPSRFLVTFLFVNCSNKVHKEKYYFYFVFFFVTNKGTHFLYFSVWYYKDISWFSGFFELCGKSFLSKLLTVHI